MMRTLVIGGGIAGLASAALAAARGESVLLLERSSVGGKSFRFELDGQSIDAGPALLSFQSLWKTLLSRLCEVDSLTYFPLETLGTHHFRGQTLELPPGSLHPMFSFWKNYLDHQDLLDMESLLTLPPRLRDLKFIQLGVQLLAHQGIHSTVASYLRSLNLPPVLEAAIGVHAFNAGIGPESVSALYASLPALMLKHGLAVPLGGMFELVLALRRSCETKGVEILEESPVTQIEPGRVWVGQRSYTYDRLISAIDYDRFRLLSGQRARISYRRTCSAVALYVVLEGSLDLPFSSVFIPRDIGLLGRDLLVMKEPEETMIFLNQYVPHAIYPKNDRTVLSILFTAPATGRSYAVDSVWIQSQLAYLEGTLGLSLRSNWRACRIFPPAFWEEGGSQGGAIYGSFLPWWRSGPFHDPPHRLGRNIWQVGTSSHPGGGVPGVLGSALMVDSQLR